MIFTLQSCPPPATKSSRAGEIGWGASTLSDFSVAQTGHQIQVSPSFKGSLYSSYIVLYTKNQEYPIS